MSPKMVGVRQSGVLRTAIFSAVARRVMGCTVKVRDFAHNVEARIVERTNFDDRGSSVEESERRSVLASEELVRPSSASSLLSVHFSAHSLARSSHIAAPPVARDMATEAEATAPLLNGPTHVTSQQDESRTANAMDLEATKGTPVPSHSSILLLLLPVADFQWQWN